jgi:hypothetical protein
MSVNLLNNWAFAYKISVPLHIILRSAGPVASMVIGYVYNGKLYSRSRRYISPMSVVEYRVGSGIGLVVRLRGIGSLG